VVGKAEERGAIVCLADVPAARVPVPAAGVVPAGVVFMPTSGVAVWAAGVVAVVRTAADNTDVHDRQRRRHAQARYALLGVMLAAVGSLLVLSVSV
jgi:hypothetical protein